MTPPPTPTPTRRSRPGRFARSSRALWAISAMAIVGFVPLASQKASAAPQAPDQREEAKRLASEREKVRAAKAQKASQMDLLSAQEKDVSAALDQLSANVAGQQDLLLEAQRAADLADKQAKDANAQAQEASKALATARKKVARRAVDAYIHLPSETLASPYDTTEATEMVSRRTYLDVAAGNDQDDVEAIRTNTEDLEFHRKEAADALERSRIRRNEVSGRLAELQSAQAQQLRFSEGVAERIAATQAEAAALAGRDEKLSKELVKQQLILAEQLRKAEEERKKREQALIAARLAEVVRQKQLRDAQAATFAASSAPIGVVGSGSIVEVGGISVHRSIADNLARLLAAARADGINLGGGGYRSSEGQIRVRRNNCGSSHYAIYEAPASSCSPPTARPGSSQHERGLAIDFEVNGDTLSRGDAGYRWLKAHAAEYGFYNLPSEAWHWSTTGR